MATKRQLKKFISRACDETAYACLVTDCATRKDTTDKINELLRDLGQLKAQALCAATFDFDKTKADFENAKAYNAAKKSYNKTAYSQLVKEFMTKLNDIVSRLNAIEKESK